MRLRQLGFTCSACGPFTKNKEKIQKFKETEDSGYIYQNKIDKACFQHDKTSGDFKDLTRRIASDKMHIEGVLLLWFIIFLKNKTLLVVLLKMKKRKNLAEELHKSTIRKFKKRKVYSPFIDNIWGSDPTDMQLISTFNKGILFLLCVFDIFSKYTWVIPLKDKKRYYNY